MKIEVNVNEITKSGKFNQIMSDGEDFVYVELAFDDKNKLKGMQIASYLYEVKQLTFGFKFQVDINLSNKDFWKIIDRTMAHRNYVLCENEAVSELVGFIKSIYEKEGKEFPHILIGKM